MVRLLGPVAISTVRGEVTVGGRREQGLLALLAVRLGQVVPTDVLVEQVWGECPPRTVRSALRVHLTRLRRALGDASSDPVPHRGDGYLLEPAHVTTDARELAQLVRRARAARTVGAHAAAVTMLRDALALRLGLPLLGLDDIPVLRQHAEDLAEQLLSAEEELLDARLAVGDHAAACSAAAALVSGAPFRERRTSMLALALFRSGRQADALAACARLRAVLAEELGVDPGPDLQELEGAVLRQEPRLGWAPPTRPGAAIPPSVGPEKLVSGALSRLVADKVARLPAAAVDTLRLAAALGSAVDPVLLQAATGLSAPEVDDALRLGQDGGMLHDDAAAAGIRWASADVAAAVVSVLDDADRRALHARAARALEATYGASGVARAVRHLVAAGASVPPGRTCAVGQLAAEYYLRAGDADRAVEVCQQVLVAVGAEAPAGDRVDVSLRLARAQALQGRVELAEETWRASVCTARELADPERFGLSVLAHEWARRTMTVPGPDRPLLQEALALVGPRPSALRVRLASALIGEAATTGEMDGLTDLVEQTLHTAGAVGDRLAEVTALHAQHVLLRASPHLAERSLIAGNLDAATGSLQDPYWVGVARLARTYDECVRGHGEAVPALVEALGDDVERSQSPRLRWHHLLTRTSALRLAGKYAAADRCAEQALVHGVSAGITDAAPAALVHRYLTDLETTTVAPLLPLVEPYCRDNPGLLLGHAALALAALHADSRALAARAADRALSLAATLPWEERTLLSLALIAATELGLSRIVHVAHVAQQLAPYGGQFVIFGQITGTGGPVDRLLGLAAAAAGDLVGGHALLQRAEYQSRQAGWAPWSVRCATDRVVLLHRWGRNARAGELARQTYPQAMALGMTPCVNALVGYRSSTA